MPRSSSSLVAFTDGKTQQTIRHSFSRPDLHHSLRSEDRETDESQEIPMLNAPVPIRWANQGLHFLSEYGYLAGLSNSRYCWPDVS